MNELELPALDGANPLGFLTALGTVAVLSETDPKIKLGWHARARWTPFLQSAVFNDESALLAQLTETFRVECQTECGEYPMECSIGPLSQCTPEKLHCFAKATTTLADSRHRRATDMVAAFGIEKLRPSKGKTDKPFEIQRTPFCFTTGSGHQEFIADARQLMTRKLPTKGAPNPPPCITEQKLRAALFNTWSYDDPGLSLRWDPAEDVRYALRLDDPGPIGAHTVWMANALAFRALPFFPCAESKRQIATSAWCDADTFQWPIWEKPLSKATIGSLLSYQAFANRITPPFRQELQARGVLAIFCSSRIKVGSKSQYKVSFSQSQQL